MRRACPGKPVNDNKNNILAVTPAHAGVSQETQTLTLNEYIRRCGLVFVWDGLDAPLSLTAPVGAVACIAVAP